jgi:hypothetical protein
MVFEDTNCKISYNLWSNKGNAGFSFFNKTNEVIFLQLDESFYVINGNAYDYYQNRIFLSSSNTATKTTKTSGYSQLGLLSLATYATNTVATNSTNGIETIEAKIIAIPPKTSKTVSEFDINQTLFRDCDLLRFPSSKQTSTKSFSDETTPLKFYNTISYKVGDKVNKVKNDFYVSEISNFAEKDIINKQKKQFCNQKYGEIINVFKDNTPDKFYVTYIKLQTDSWKY